MKRHVNEDNLKTEDNPQNEDDLKTEDDISLIFFMGEVSLQKGFPWHIQRCCFFYGLMPKGFLAKKVHNITMTRD